MKIENINKLYELDNKRRMLSKSLEALEKSCSATNNRPYVYINTEYDSGIRITFDCAIELKDIIAKKLSLVEQEIQEL